jgi:hypothetical protein
LNLLPLPLLLVMWQVLLHHHSTPPKVALTPS